MGTTWSVKAVAPGRNDGELRGAIERRLDELVQQMSAWEPDSDLSRFHRAPAGTWQKLPDDLYRVIVHARDLAEKTDGAFDPTIAPLVELWGFGASGKSRTAPPSREEIEAARSWIGWQKIQLDPSNQSLLQPGGLSLDINAIGPGYAVDQIGAVLKQQGIENFLVELGGEMLASGRRPDGSPWRVAVERPDQSDGDASFDTIVELDNAAIGSSGDYRVGFLYQGRRYSHTIDPRTGEPVEHEAAAVSVIAGDAMSADAMAAALLVLGPKEGLRYAQRRDIAAVFTLRKGKTYKRVATAQFSKMLAQ